jgi:four helix bundle protein
MAQSVALPLVMLEVLAMASRDYRDLIAWEKSFTLTLTIYKETSSFPSEERYGLTSQLRRAAVSIPSNIAEGEGRGSRYFRHYLSIALGSLNELETQILISDALGYLGQGQATVLMEMTAEVGRLINGLSRAILQH